MNLTVVKLRQIVDFLRRNGRRLWLGPLAVLPPRPVVDVQDDAASSLGLGNIEGVEELALDETPVDGRPLVRLQSLVQIGEKALPGGRRLLEGHREVGALPAAGPVDLRLEKCLQGLAVPRQEEPLVSLDDGGPDVFADLAAIREVGAVTRRAKRIPVAIDFDAVVAAAAHHGMRRPLPAADRDDGAHAMVAKAFSPNWLRNRTGQVPGEHRMNQYD